LEFLKNGMIFAGKILPAMMYFIRGFLILKKEPSFAK
jgi:hypothetical protein